MFKKTLIIATCICGSLLAEEEQIGRYQMTAATHATGNTVLYLLDTATGKVWRSINVNNWVEHDTWSLQIKNPPPQTEPLQTRAQN